MHLRGNVVFLDFNLNRKLTYIVHVQGGSAELEISVVNLYHTHVWKGGALITDDTRTELRFRFETHPKRPARKTRLTFVSHPLI